MISQVSQNDTFQIWLSKTNQIITVVDALTDGVLYVNGALIFTNSTFSLSLTSMNITNNMIVTNPSGNSVILLSSNAVVNGTIFTTGTGVSLDVANTALFTGNVTANTVYINGSGRSLFVANNVTVGGNMNTNNLNVTTSTILNQVNATSISSNTLYDNAHRVITSVSVTTTNGLTGATTINGPTGTIALGQTLVDSISSNVTTEAPTANAVSWGYNASIVQFPTTYQNQINSNFGGWSDFNIGKQLYLTGYPNSSHPALGISDYLGANNWAISNIYGDLSFVAMPPLANSNGTPNIVMSISNTAVNVTGNINYTGILSSYPDKGRNKFDNPIFTQWQRGAGPYPIANTAGAIYTFDRWFTEIFGGAATVNILQLSATDKAQIGNENGYWYYNCVFTGSNNVDAYTIMGQRIPAIWQYSNQTITVSFWAKAASNGTQVGVRWVYVNTGGIPPSSPPSPNLCPVFTLTTNWVRYQATFNLDSTASYSFGSPNFVEIEFWLSAGSIEAATYVTGMPTQSGTVSFWGMQLETTPYATPLSLIDYYEDYKNCLQYYQGNKEVYFSGFAWGAPYTGADFYITQMFSFPKMISQPTVLNLNFGSTNILNAIMGPLASSTSDWYIQGQTGGLLPNGTGQWILEATFALSADL